MQTMKNTHHDRMGFGVERFVKEILVSGSKEKCEQGDAKNGMNELGGRVVDRSITQSISYNLHYTKYSLRYTINRTQSRLISLMKAIIKLDMPRSNYYSFMTCRKGSNELQTVRKHETSHTRNTL